MSNAISAQGTVVYRQTNGSGAFVAVGNLHNVTPPALTRNAIETTTHNDPDDSHVVGIRRRGPLSLNIGFLPKSADHGAASGLQKSWMDGAKDGWKIVYPDTGEWVFSGYITNISVAAPVDDELTADVEIQPTGLMSVT